MSSVIDKLVSECACAYDKYAEEAYFSELSDNQRTFIDETATEINIEVYEDGEIYFTGKLSEYLYINQFEPEIVEAAEALEHTNRIELYIDDEFFDCVVKN